MKVITVVLAGGSGTRLWPLSRENHPKQFLRLGYEETLLERTMNRISASRVVDTYWVLTARKYQETTEKLLKNLDVPVEVILEPEGKNTGPAIIWMAERARNLYGEDSILLVLPSDHEISNESEFVRIVEIGIRKAMDQNLVTFGIIPDSPETGYGYIKVSSDKPVEIGKPLRIEQFVEKPDLVRAKEFVSSGVYLWNSGMFAFHVGALLNETQVNCPSLFQVFNGADPFDESSIRSAFERVENISIDYALMEKVQEAYVIPAEFGWNDIGSWHGVLKLLDKDANGNAKQGNVYMPETKNSLVMGDKRLVVTYGLENVVVVDTDDVTLVVSVDKAEDIKQILNDLPQEKERNYR